MLRTRRSVLAAPLLAALFAGSALAEPITITFLHTNDVYEISPKKGRGGLAELMTLLQQERARGNATVTTFGGDLISPSLMSGLTKGEQMIEVYNALGVDAAVLGNHEFDFGPEIAKQRIAQSTFSWLGSNVEEGGKLFAGLKEPFIKEVAGYKIGFFGVVEPDTVVLSSPGKDTKFNDPIKAAEAATKKLRDEGADLVVALTHLDFAEDRELAAKVKGIDLIFGGHDHEPMSYLESGKLIVKAGSDANWLAAVDLTVDRVGDKKVVTWTPAWRFVVNAGVQPHASTKAIVDKWNKKLDDEMGVVIGKVTVDVDSKRDSVRTQENALGNLMADAVRNSMGGDVAIINGGGIRGDRVYAAGTEIIRKDILGELPFGNVSVLTELKGVDLWQALDSGVSQIEQKAGRFPQVSGLTFTYDSKLPAGSRVTEVKVGGQPLDPAKLYKVATVDYLLTGGDGYAALTRGKVIVDASGSRLMATTVMNYITAQGGAVAPKVEGRITRLN